MKYLFTSLALLVLLPFCSSAQTNFRPGYIVSFKGDTIKGDIDYKDWNNNPTAIRFKSNTNASNIDVYTPANISAFGFNDIIYRRYAGPISVDQVELTRLANSIDTTYKTDTVFIRFVNQGKNLTLYQYIDDLKIRYFVAEKSGQPYELLNRIYLNNGVEEHENKYLQQLQKLRLIYIPQDNNLIAEIQRTPYRLDEMARIINLLNDKKTDRKAYVNRGAFRFFVGAGASHGTIRLENYLDFVDSKSAGYTSPMLSAGLDFILNKHVGKLIFRGELLYYANKVSLYYSTVGLVPAAPRTSTFGFDQSVIAFIPQVVYNFYNKPDFKFMALLG